MKLFKSVKKLFCLFCEHEFNLNSNGFMLINKHGWGYCKECFTRIRVINAMEKDGYDPRYFIAEQKTICKNKKRA